MLNHNHLYHFLYLSCAESLSDVIKGGVEQLASNLATLQSSQQKDARIRSSDYRPVNGGHTAGHRSPRSKQYGNGYNIRTEGDGCYKAVDIERPADEDKTDSDQILVKSGMLGLKKTSV